MRLFLILFSLVLFASCSSSKRISKSTVNVAKKDSTGSLIDTSKTVVIEETREEIKTPGDSISVEVDITKDSTETDKDTSVITAENDNLKVKVIVDKKNKKATVKAYQKPKESVKTTTKTTIEQKGVTQKTTNKIETKQVEKDAVKIPKVNWTLIIVAAIAIIILFIFLWFKIPSLRRPKINSSP